MTWVENKNKSRRKRRQPSKNFHRKWKKSLIAAADEVIAELVKLAEKQSENTPPSDG
jgi:hypothetical protein